MRSSAAPPVPSAYGIWRATGGNHYQAKYEFYATRVPDTSEHLPSGSGWLPASRGVTFELISISSDGRTYTSNIRYEIYDRSEAQIQDSGDGKREGARVKF